MTQVKTGSAEETGAEYIVSNDPSCMLQIRGYLEKQGSSLKCLHLAQVLAKTSSDGLFSQVDSRIAKGVHGKNADLTI